MDNYSQTRRLRRRVDDNFNRSSIEVKQKRRANDWLDRHRNLLAVVEGVDGYEDFVLSYIQREQSRNAAGEREERVCTCEPSNCPLKKGKLPREVREAPTVDAGIAAFRTRPFHDGEPVVLTEAKEAYGNLVAAAATIYREATIVLTGDDVEAPDEPIELSTQAEEALGALPNEAAPKTAI